MSGKSGCMRCVQLMRAFKELPPKANRFTTIGKMMSSEDRNRLLIEAALFEQQQKEIEKKLK